MYVFETLLAGIHWNALERILERVRNVNERVRNANGPERVWNQNGTRSERKWSAFGAQMERERSVRFFLSSIVSCKFSFVISI